MTPFIFEHISTFIMKECLEFSMFEKCPLASEELKTVTIQTTEKLLYKQKNFDCQYKKDEFSFIPSNLFTPPSSSV